MAVESFIPIKDVKMTTEKEVKRKPTIAELTTIERPGKPVPATFLDYKNDSEPKPKKVRKPKREKSDDVKVVAPKKDSILIITEKPQAAQKIAYALGSPHKLTESGVSYFEVNRNGKNIIVASAVGHLFNLTYKKGQTGWPIFDVEWIPSFTKKEADYTRRYYVLLKKLAARSDELIVATDFDVEGELIGWNVVRFICNRSNAKRMKFSTLTSNELEKAFDSPLSEINWNNAYAGETRHIIDWLYGINLSRALMSALKKTKAFRILSIGRVQGPALKIIVDREKEIMNFKPEPYWQVFAMANNLKFKHPEDIFDKTQLEKFKNITSAQAKTDDKESKELPPHPFDLTTLQREAYKLYKISPSETLKIAQKLYLDGVISYPRTSSQKIPDSIKPKDILNKLSRAFKETSEAVRDKPIEGSKSDPAHPSIYPTGEYSSSEGQERKLYELIVKRFISAFAKDAVIATRKITLTADNDIKFTLFGDKVLEKGWMKVYPYKIDEMDLPVMNGKVKIDEIKIEEKETQPPKRYTPTSLITLLEKKNLGTKTTRSLIIDTLYDRGYVDGNTLEASPLGIRLIESLERYSPIIIDENLTRQLEDEMEKFQEENKDLDKKEKEIIEKAKRLITDISKEFKVKEQEIGEHLHKAIVDIREEQNQSNILMPCPTCKKGNLRIMFNKNARRYFVACSNYPECKQTYSLPPNALIKRSGNQCEADKWPKLLAIRKAKRPWEFCFNPDCPIEKAKKEKYQQRKGNYQQQAL